MQRGLALGISMLVARMISGGVVLDGSFGTSGALPGPNYMIQAGFGKTVGNNLFQSFNQFSLVSTESAVFSGPANIQNIVSRVTGGTASSIDGKVSSEIDGANLFFVNPVGVVLGPNAKLDVKGSVAFSTANYLKQADGGRFNASLGGQDTLTSAPITAFGFLGSPPPGITVNGPFLFLRGQQNLAFVGGDVTVRNGSDVTAANGTIFICGTKSMGEVRLDIGDRSNIPDISSFSALGDVKMLAGTSITTVRAGTPSLTGGRIVVRAANFSGVNSMMNVSARDGSRADGIDVQLTDSMSWLGSLGGLSVTTGGDVGQATVLRLSAKHLLVSLDGSINLSSAAASGSGGRAEIDVNDLKIASGGQINLNAESAARGGDLFVTADTVSLSTDTAILSSTTGTGTGGVLRMQVGGLLRLEGDAKIATDTFGHGNGGDMVISAGSILVTGAPGVPADQTPAGIVSAVDPGASGKGGNIAITAQNDLTLMAGATIQTNTQSTGHGGNLTINATTISLDGNSTSVATAVAEGVSGIGGDLTITATGGVDLSNQAAILCQTNGSGAGGNLRVQSNALTVSSGAGIGANTINPNANGAAGTANINVTGDVQINSGGQISDSTLGPGSGGDLSLTAASLTLTGTNSAVIAQTTNGTGANVQIDVAGPVKLQDGAKISLTTDGSGASGMLTLNANDLVVVGGDSAITAQTKGTGKAGDLQFNLSNSLQVLNGANITANTFGAGAGGSISIRAGSVQVSGGNATSPTQIAAQTESTGSGGNIDINVSGSIQLDSQGKITAATLAQGDGGHITIFGKDLFASGDQTGISVQTTSTNPGGPGGDLQIALSGRLQLSDKAQIVAGTMSPSANAGKISIKAQDIDLSGGAGIGSESLTPNAGNAGSINIVAASAIHLSGGAGISSLSKGVGKAGSVDLRAGGEIELVNSTISVQALTSDAGQISVTSSRDIVFKDSAVTASAGANGGDILIRAPDLVYLLNSGITATAGTIQTNSGTGGTGGNVVIDPVFIVLNNSLISANAAIGQGGNINLISNFFFASSSPVTATGTTNGTVNIVAPALDLGTELITLPASLVSAENQLRERCTALLQGDFSSFISIGRGGTEEEPEELQSEF